MILQIATAVFVLQAPKVSHRNINCHQKTEMPRH